MPIDIEGQTVWVECLGKEKNAINNGDIVMDFVGGEGGSGAASKIFISLFMYIACSF